MDSKKLDALLAAARLGSLSRAAEELGYTQSGLGYMIDSLEAELGCRLTHRDHRGVRLSAEGEQLLPDLRRAAAANHALADHAKALAQNGLHIRALPLDPPCHRELGIAVKRLRAAAPMTRRFIHYCKKAEY